VSPQENYHSDIHNNCNQQEFSPQPTQNNQNNFEILYKFDTNNFSLNKKFWTKDEDDKLTRLVNSPIGRNWKKISGLVASKTPQQCAYRYNKLMSNITTRKWSRNEDIILIELSEIYGENWREISNRMENRNFEEVKERFEKKLDPKLKRCKFKKEEDEMILSLFEKYGNKWDDIAKFFDDRSADMIKNRFYSHLKKKNSKNLSNVDTSQNENNFDSKSLTTSSQNNFINRECSKTSLENRNERRKQVDRYFEKKKFNSVKKELNIYNFSHEDENNNRENNQEMFPDNLKYVNNPEDFSMSINTPDTAINQNIDGFFNFNLNEKSNSTTFRPENNSNFHARQTKNFHRLDTINFTTTQKIENITQSPFHRHQSLDIILDYSETNNIPKQMMAVDTDSPKNDSTPDDPESTFNRHYANIFKSKKNSFDQDNFFEINKTSNIGREKSDTGDSISSENYIKQNLFANTVNVTNNANNIYTTTQLDDDALYKKYKLLEGVFEKVKDVSSYRVNEHSKIFLIISFRREQRKERRVTCFKSTFRWEKRNSKR